MEDLIRIIENYVEIDEITESANFRTDLALSSFDTVCMVDEIESELGVKIELKDFAKYKTVGEMAEYIASQKN